MPFAPDPLAPIETYIGKEFLNLSQEVEEINLTCDDEPFVNELSVAFEFIRPESKKLLGLEIETNLNKPLAKHSMK